MEHKEVLELKRRLKKTSCSIDRVCGCYVDAGKEKVTQFNHTFLNLEDVEFHKYLEIANKCLSGKIGNSLMTLDFSTDQEINGEAHKLLMGLRNSKLKDEGLLDAFYDHVIETYEYVGNYLILVFHDVYDVPVKTTDNLKIDESEEVYEYILCAICPVDLSKPGLGYLSNKNDIGARERDWVVGAVDTGFLFPAFNDRSADIHSVLCYTKNTKEPHEEFWEHGIEVGVRMTSDQKRTAFESLVVSEGNRDATDGEDILLEVQKNINDYIVEKEAELERTDEPLTQEELTLLFEESGIGSEKAAAITKRMDSLFKNEAPAAKELLDEKTIKNNELRIENMKLKEKVALLTKKLAEFGVDIVA